MENTHRSQISFILTLSNTIATFNNTEEVGFESILGKGENAGKLHLLLFPKCFLPVSQQTFTFESKLLCCLQALSFWISLKCCFVKS